MFPVFSTSMLYRTSILFHLAWQDIGVPRSYTKRPVPGCLSPHPRGKGIRVRGTGVLRGSDLLIVAGFFDRFRIFAFYLSFCHKLCMPLKKITLFGFGPAFVFPFLFNAFSKKFHHLYWVANIFCICLSMPAPQARPASAEFLPMPDLPQFTQPEDSAQVVQSV